MAGAASAITPVQQGARRVKGQSSGRLEERSGGVRKTKGLTALHAAVAPGAVEAAGVGVAGVGVAAARGRKQGREAKGRETKGKKAAAAGVRSGAGTGAGAGAAGLAGVGAGLDVGAMVRVIRTGGTHASPFAGEAAAGGWPAAEVAGSVYEEHGAAAEVLRGIPSQQQEAPGEAVAWRLDAGGLGSVVA